MSRSMLAFLYNSQQASVCYLVCCFTVRIFGTEYIAMKCSFIWAQVFKQSTDFCSGTQKKSLGKSFSAILEKGENKKRMWEREETRIYLKKRNKETNNMRKCIETYKSHKFEQVSGCFWITSHRYFWMWPFCWVVGEGTCFLVAAR